MLLLASCSFNKNSGFWSGAKTIKKENVINTTEIFKEKKAYEKEINPNLKIQLSLKPKSSLPKPIEKSVTPTPYRLAK